MEKSDAVTAMNISEQRIAARISLFISNIRFGTDVGDYCRSNAYHWESPVVRRHRCQIDRRKKRGFKSSANLTHFAAVLTIGTCMVAEPYVLKHREGN